jgi:hypothetical protein
MRGWSEYRNDDYGFSFRYPPGWDLKLDENPVSTSYHHLVRLTPLQWPDTVMAIGFKRAGEDFGIQRTGVGSGELVEQGAVSFLGQDVSRVVLVLDATDRGVLYNGAAEIQRDELIFTLALDFLNPAPDAAGLSAEVEAVADRIVASFDLSQ